MDWHTTMLLAPLACFVFAYAVGSVAAIYHFGRGTPDATPWRYLALVIVATVASVIWLAYIDASYTCLWEGFADGLLPVECRPPATS